MDNKYRESLWNRATHKTIARALSKTKNHILEIPSMVETTEDGGHPLHHALFLYGANSVIALIEAAMANELDRKKLRLEEVTRDYLTKTEQTWLQHIQFVDDTIDVVREEVMESVTVPLYEVPTAIEAMSLCAFLNGNGIKGKFSTEGNEKLIRVKPSQSTSAIAALYSWFDRKESDFQILKKVVTRRLGHD